VDEAQPLHKLRVLDVGCGGGILSESMARMGAQVHGIDVTDKNIVVARHHAHTSGLNVRYENITVGALHQHEPDYDIVLNMEVLEHVPDVAALVADCIHLLRPGGVLVLATINRTLLSWLFAIVGAEYVLRWLPRGTHRWRRFVTPRELGSLLAAGDMRIVAQTGVRVNPFNRHFSLTQRMAVNYMLVAQHNL
ncbi:MAG: 2-polyprenyl-6-hydroxyphenyl methylase/3-demethylubiquinone-9 3-methyltransferase, partial [Gammaproteobacteria bacterium]